MHRIVSDRFELFRIVWNRLLSISIFRHEQDLRLHEVQERKRLQNGRSLSRSRLQRRGLIEAVAFSRNVMRPTFFLETEAAVAFSRNVMSLTFFLECSGLRLEAHLIEVVLKLRWTAWNKSRMVSFKIIVLFSNNSLVHALLNCQSNFYILNTKFDIKWIGTNKILRIKNMLY